MAALPVPLPRPAARWRLAAYGVLAVCLGAAVWSILADPAQQGDFALLRAAAKAWKRGLNPYDPGVLSRVLGWRVGLPFYYPPDTLGLFGLFNLLPRAAVRAVYLGLELLAAGWLFSTWQRWFLDPEDPGSPWFAGFCLFGLGTAFLLDLRAGNISTFEQALLWAGLAAYLRGRAGWFGALVWLAAACKLNLLAFSVLLLLDGPAGRHPRLFAGLWAAMAARLWLDYLADPPLFRAYLNALSHMGNHVETGMINPSSLEWVRVALWLNRGGELADQPRPLLYPLYALLVLGVGGASWRAWRALRRRPATPRREVLGVCLACLAFALTVPRLKDYSCILLLLPVWVAFKTALAGRRDVWLAVIAAACLISRSPFPWLNNAAVLLWEYQPLTMAFAAWALLVWHVHRGVPAEQRRKG